MLWIFLLILFGFGGGGGLGLNRMGGAGQVINDQAITGQVEAAMAKMQATNNSNELLQQAITGNTNAIQSLAQTLNCDMSKVQSALCNLQGGIDKLSGQVGLSVQQIVSAIQAGNAALTNQILNCCCEMKTLITNLNYETRIQDLQNTQRIVDGQNITNAKIDAQTQIIQAGVASILNSQKDEKIAQLTSENNAYRTAEIVKAAVKETKKE